MKKIVIVFIILVFVGCAFIGFKTAAKILPNGKSNPLFVQNSSGSTGILQQNYLLIHVNDLTLDNPDLVSVWAVFVYQSKPPQLMFVPLYPSYNADVHNQITQSFSLGKDRVINTKFINQISKSFDIKISGYVLSDNVGVGFADQWLTGQQATVTSTPAATDEEKQAIRANGETSYKQFCQLVSADIGNSFFSAVDWTLLLPDHFSTNIPFETIALATDQLVRATTPIQCEVLPGQ